MCDIFTQHERIKTREYECNHLGTKYAEHVLKLGLCFCNFDFAGCGNSEGETISFGTNEKNDT